MSFEPTPTQALLLFGLLSRHGECPQAELMPAPTKADREALLSAKLIGVVKNGRSFQLDLTDAGWAWAGGHLAAALPPAHGTLHDLLGRLGDHLARSGETLADFIGNKPADPAAATKRKMAEEKERAADEKKERAAREKQEKAVKPTTKPKSVPRLRPPTQTALRKRVETAYLALTSGRKDESVRLALLRAELSDLDRTTLDGALGRILSGDTLGRKKASMMRNDDPRRLDQADRDAAFNPNGEPFHIIWIAS